MTTHAQAHFDDDRERVRSASGIVDVIGEHVSLKPKGREYVGLCPFHDDHKPSMTVVPAKQIFCCFSCGAAGDVFGFVQRYHQMNFREALEFLAARAGVELSARAPAPDDGPRVSRQDLAAANALACSYFRALLAHAEHGSDGRGTIASRGIADEMVERFALGVSADRPDGLIRALQHKGQGLEASVAAGLIRTRNDGSRLDGFRRRLMFPIHDRFGRVVAFGARRLHEEDEPKYLNSPESPIFRKSATLYGLFQGLDTVRAQRTVIVTEGYTDVIACHQAGITNAVATLGTALTAEHARVLRGLCDTVVLLFDSDEAGERAADRAIDVFFAEPMDVRIATLGAGSGAKDPDELLTRDGGRATLDAVIADATDLLEFLFRRTRERISDQSEAGAVRTINELLDRFTQLGIDRIEPIRRQRIIRRLSEVAGVPWEVAADSLRRRETRRRPGAQVEAKHADRAIALSREECALACLLCDGRLWASATAAERDALLGEMPSAALASIAAALRASAEQAGHPDRLAVLGILGDDLDASSAATLLCSRLDALVQSDAARLEGVWRDLLAEVRRAQRALPGADAISRLESLRANARDGRNPRALARPTTGVGDEP